MANEIILPPELKLETRRLVNAIVGLQKLEDSLPEVQTIEELENMRAHCMALDNFARAKQKSGLKEWLELGKELENWAIRVSMLCQRRVGQLLGEAGKNKGGRPSEKKTSAPRAPVSAPPPPSLSDLGLSKHYAADAQVLASEPENAIKERLDEAAKNGSISRKAIIADVRKDARARGEKLDEKTVQKRADWRIERTKRRDRAAAEAPQKAPSDKFKAYWSREKKLLFEFFEIEDLPLMAEKWWQEIHAIFQEEQQILLQRRQESQRRKALTELARDAGNADAGKENFQNA